MTPEGYMTDSGDYCARCLPFVFGGHAVAIRNGGEAERVLDALAERMGVDRSAPEMPQPADQECDCMECGESFGPADE